MNNIPPLPSTPSPPPPASAIPPLPPTPVEIVQIPTDGLLARLAGEPDLAWAKVKAYVEMGPERSITGLARKLGLAHSGISELAAKWDWRARATAHDAALQRLDVARRSNALATIESGALAAAAALAQALELGLRSRLEHVASGGTLAMEARDIVATLEALVKVHRLYTGGSTSNVAIATRGAEPEYDLDKLTADEAMALAELMAKCQPK